MKHQRNFIRWQTSLLFLYSSIFLLIIPLSEAAFEVKLLPPGVARPGDTLQLQFILRNTGSESHVNVTALLETEDDLFLTSSALQSLSIIRAGEQNILTYQIGILNSASGSQTVKLRFGALNSPAQTESFDISVAASKDTLLISRAVAQPKKLEPGGIGELFIEIENIGDEKVKDIFIKLDFSGDIPFAPRESATEKSIERINKKSKEQVSFPFSIMADAAEKIYKIPIEIFYTDNSGETFSKKDLIAVEVGTIPEIEVHLDSQGFIAGKKSSVSFTVVNRGLGDIQFLIIKLLQGNYEILSGDRVYIGNVDSDDFQTADFEIVFKEQGTLIALEASYKDSSNAEYVQNIELPIKIYSQEKARDLGLVQSNSRIYLATGAIIFFILLFVVIKMRKRVRLKFKEKEI